jgi:hypothetical protein
MNQDKLKVYRRTMPLLWRAIDTVRGKIAMAAFVLLLLSRSLSGSVSWWPEINPLWAFAPIVIVCIWSLAELLVKTEADRDELLKRLGEAPVHQESSDGSQLQHMITGGLIALSLVAVGVAIGTEIIPPRIDFDGWKFVERESPEGLLHDLVDSDGTVIATLLDRDTTITLAPDIGLNAWHTSGHTTQNEIVVC